ncbi:M23 family metallopeptidase [Sphingomonas sp.]|uniref:M23 family metallopeptidase n=1 Tax=Sphingomonas sp. TaxID=28214 RepID=UPI003CC6C05D
MKALGAVLVLTAAAGATPQRPSAPVAEPSPAARWTGQAVQGALLSGTVAPGVTGLTLVAPDVPDRPAALQNGRFMIGLDRDAPAVETLVGRFADGREQRLAIEVRPRAWRIERVNAMFHPPGFDARRPAELARIAAARTQANGGQADPRLDGWSRPLAWPLTGPVRGLFGAQRVYRGGIAGGYHGGIDIAAGTGTVVRAPGRGRVVLVADPPFTLEGRLLMIDHGGGLISALMHLSRIDVREGALVEQGQPIGAVGATGRVTGPHLHWGLTWRDARLDPLLVAGPMR